MAKLSGFNEEVVIQAGSSGGECLGHLDGNDTGKGNKVHGHTPWGSSNLEEVGLKYIHGHEGLPDGALRDTDLWHMVMIIA